MCGHVLGVTRVVGAGAHCGFPCYRTDQRLLCRKTEEGVGQKEDPAQTGREKQGLRDKVQETPGPREEEKGAEAKGTLRVWPGHFSVQLGQGVLETASLCCLGVP